MGQVLLRRHSHGFGFGIGYMLAKRQASGIVLFRMQAQASFQIACCNESSMCSNISLEIPEGPVAFPFGSEPIA